jgi:proteasome lid subunit RPN8/RPN11
MLNIGRREYEEIRRHGEDTYPLLSCGILLGRWNGDDRVVISAVQCRNAADSPHDHYLIDPVELVQVQRSGRERGEDIVAFYHSHPDRDPRWNQLDFADAHWFGLSYVITSVVKGKAESTQSFELSGEDEATKSFLDEEILLLEPDSTEALPTGGSKRIIPRDSTLFERLSPSSRDALARANGMRRKLAQDAVHMRHLVTALFEKTDGPTQTLFRAAEIDQPTLIKLIEKATGSAT